MRRFAAVAFEDLRIALARGMNLSVTSAPLALVIARKGGAVQRETDLLGNTRIDEVSREARALGVLPGQTIAAARARAAALAVRVVAEDAVREELGRLAEAALAFGATVAFDDAQDVVWADVTGCAHLFGGEEALAEKLAECMYQMGHPCRLAIADGPRVAAAMARFGEPSRRVRVVAPGTNAAALSALPLCALPLDGETLAWLGNVGMATVGDLQKQPPRGLGTQLGAAAAGVMQLLAGQDWAPLVPYRPPQVLEERAELEYGIASTEALLFVAKSLCDRVAARLEGRAMAAARLELVSWLDRALSDEPSAQISVGLPSPLVRAADLFAVLRARLESRVVPISDDIDPSVLPPILAVTLRVPELAARNGRARDMFEPEARADVALPKLVAELTAELGASSVGTLSLENTWVEGRRASLQPPSLTPSSPDALTPLLTASAPEPTRMLPRPIPIDRDCLERPVLLAHVESVEWWRPAPRPAHDFVAAWIHHPIASGLAWIEHQSRRLHIRGWLD